MEICWFNFSLRVRWSPGHDNPAKNFIQLPGTDVVGKLARIVRASVNKGEWCTRPFTLNQWGEDAFITKLQGVNSVKRARIEARAEAFTVGCNTEVEEISSKQTIRQQNKVSAKLPALHPPMQIILGGVSTNFIGKFYENIV